MWTICIRLWYSVEERKQIAKRIEKEFHISNCGLMQGGTLLSLGIEPECEMLQSLIVESLHTP